MVPRRRDHSRTELLTRLRRDFECGGADVFQYRIRNLVDLNFSPARLKVNLQDSLERHLIFCDDTVAQPDLECPAGGEGFDVLLAIAHQQELSTEIGESSRDDAIFNLETLMTAHNHPEFLVRVADAELQVAVLATGFDFPSRDRQMRG